MSDVFEQLGLDPEDIKWTDLSLCVGMPTNMFFDDYESSEQVARTIDEVCLSCPVMVQCLQRGIEEGAWGVRGGIYLTSGRPDAGKNAHKEPKVWETIKGRIGGESVL